MGVPLLWALRETIEVTRGAPSPNAAANGYLMAHSYGAEDGLLPLLDDGRQVGPLRQGRDYRATQLAAEQAGALRGARLSSGLDGTERAHPTARLTWRNLLVP